MARATAILAALGLALAGCSVDVEGARCLTAGSTAECPSGQACGVDGRCSARAAQCVDGAQRCVPGARRCSAVGEREETCTTSDPCGAWEFVPGSLDCAAAGLRCAGDATPWCECAPFDGAEFAADPVAGSPGGAAPFPTGAASPPACRYRSLADAIDRAAQAQAPATVRAYGAAGAEVVFDASTGDVPIAVPATMTVAGAAGAAATILRGAPPSGVPLVALSGAIEGFTIEATGAGVAVATACGAATPSLTSVAVDGNQVATTGVDVSGTCGAVLSGVDVANVAGPALRVGADATATVSVYGGALRNSGVGARITGGKVVFGVLGDPQDVVDVTANAGEGLLLTGLSTAIEAQVESARISANGGTGIVVDVVSASSKLTIRGCDVFSNGIATPREYGGASARLVGGVLLRQSQLAAFTFADNRVYANHADQLAFASSGIWSISAGACGPESNRFACVPNGAYSVSILGTGAVNADANVWPIEPPDTTVNGAVTTAEYCSTEAGLPSPPQCVAP